MKDTNFNIKSFSSGNGYYECTLATGEKLIEKEKYIRLYAWVDDDDNIVFTITETPTIKTDALSGLSAADVISIDEVDIENETIIIDDTNYVRSSNDDIELV